MRIFFLNKPAKVGGPGTFQIGITECLTKKGFNVEIYPSKNKPNVIFVISGTRRLFLLATSKFKKVKIIHRLDGYNWRSLNQSINLYIYVKSRIQNLIIYIIRRFFADVVVYQSAYLESTWNDKFGPTKAPSVIIHNSASKVFFGNQSLSRNSLYRVVCVEGSIEPDRLTNRILEALDTITLNVQDICSIEIYGKVNGDMVNKYSNINFNEVIKREEIPKIYSEDRVIFFLLERNPPCPNSLIESLCSGVPSIGLDEGSYVELSGKSGFAINPIFLNSLEQEELNSEIKNSIQHVINNYDQMSSNSINRSKLFAREIMCDKYIKLLESK